jgi:diguanylate cyclase (GGDEF)-like protein
LSSRHQVFDRRRIVILLCIMLMGGFTCISLIGYWVSRQAITEAIISQDLPLTSSNIYSEIQKDLVRPVLISSTMASDTFVRQWVLEGERDPAEMARYLREVRQRYGAFSSFFVSERSGNYYTGDGILKKISATEPRDAWYTRVRALTDPYEINVDPDQANRDALTIFINYRVFDFDGRLIGATGIGLTVDAVRKLISDYQQRFARTIYFVDPQGRIVLFGDGSGRSERNLHAAAGLGPMVERILREGKGSYQFTAGGDNHILDVNYLPELKWYLFVEQNEAVALAGVRQTLYLNLGLSLLITVLVVALIHAVLGRYQQRIEDMASTDKLTGLLNRHAFAILVDKLVAEVNRDGRPFALLLADIDHFKAINDRYGHRTGDLVLTAVAQRLQARLRASDLAVRWGGEEFLMLIRGCDAMTAQGVGEQIREEIAAAPVLIDDDAITVTVSIGVAVHTPPESPEQTVGQADAGLLAAKQAGRNRVVAMDRKPAIEAAAATAAV